MVWARKIPLSSVWLACLLCSTLTSLKECLRNPCFVALLWYNGFPLPPVCRTWKRLRQLCVPSHVEDWELKTRFVDVHHPFLSDSTPIWFRQGSRCFMSFLISGTPGSWIRSCHLCSVVFIEAAGQAGDGTCLLALAVGEGKEPGWLCRQGRAVFALRALGFLNKILQ